MEKTKLEKTDGKNHQTELLEIKDAQLIFRRVWEKLEETYGHDHLQFPKEIILLGGAPGSGKGTQTRFIMKARGFTCPPVVVSDLLQTPEMKRIKASGGMVGDNEVVGLVFEKMLEPDYRDGIVLDGFPRTRVQVECLRMLVDKISALHKEFSHTPLALNFRRPTIHIMILFVDEKTSIERQLKRGKQILIHNQEVEETGVGERIEIRSTDLDETAARRRYKVFKEQTWDALQSLKKEYHYHFINGMGNIREVEQNILNELRYQSSLELEPATFDLLRGLTLAKEIVVHARQDLVKRLDSYALDHEVLFKQVITLVKEKFMPIIVRHAISGRAVVNTEEKIFDNPLAISMLIDIFSERGYHAVVDKQLISSPKQVDLSTGEIINSQKTVYHVVINFKGSEIRRG